MPFRNLSCPSAHLILTPIPREDRQRGQPHVTDGETHAPLSFHHLSKQRFVFGGHTWSPAIWTGSPKLSVNEPHLPSFSSPTFRDSPQPPVPLPIPPQILHACCHRLAGAMPEKQPSPPISLRQHHRFICIPISQSALTSPAGNPSLSGPLPHRD